MAKSKADALRPILPLDPITGLPQSPAINTGPYQFGAPAGTGGLSFISDIDLTEFDRLVPSPILTGDDAYDYERLVENRAQNQTAAGQWVNGIAKFGIKTTAGVAGGLFMIPSAIAVTLGQIADVAIPGDVVKWSDIYNNVFQNALDDIGKWSDKKMPIYLTKAQQEMSIGRQMGQATFWAEDFLGGMSFMTSAILTEMIASGITAATLGAGAGAQAAVTQGVLARAAKVMKQMQKGASFDDIIKNYENLGKAGVYFKRMNGARSFFTGAGYEAGVEARHFLDEARTDLVNSFTEANGRAPNEEELADINEKTARLANGVFATNLALVGTSNAAIFAKTFAPVRNAMKSTKKALVGGTGIGEGVLAPVSKVGDKLVLREIGKWEKGLTATYKLLKAPFVEGVFEEGLQGVTSSAALDYVMQKYNPAGADGTYTLVEALQKGFEEAYGTKEGQKEVLIGALMGLMGSPVTKFEGSSVKDMVDYLRKDNPYKQLVDRYNNYGTLPSVNAYVKSMNRGFILNQKEGEAVDNRDVFDAKNREDDDLFNMLSARDETGYLEQVLDDFDVAVQDYTSESEEEGLHKLAVEMGYDANTSTQEMKQRLDEVRGALQDRITAFKKARQTAEDILIMDDRELKEGLSYVLYNIDRKDNRLKSVAAEIQRTFGEADTRKLEDIRKANLSIMFHRGWRKTFEHERDKAIRRLRYFEKSVAKKEAELEEAKQKFEQKLKRLGQRRTPKTIKQIDDINKIMTDAQAKRGLDTGISDSLLQELKLAQEEYAKINKIQEEVIQEQIKANEQLDIIKGKIAKELQDRRNTSVPFEIDSEEFDANMKAALELHKKLEKHYQDPTTIDKDKIQNLFNDLHKLDAYRKQLILEYNLFSEERGQQRFKENIEELKAQAMRGFAQRVKLEEQQRQDLVKNEETIKRLATKLYGNYSDSTKLQLIEFLKDSMPSVEEQALLSAANQGEEALQQLIDAAKQQKISEGHAYASNLFRNMGRVLLYGEQQQQAEKEAQETAQDEAAAPSEEDAGRGQFSVKKKEGEEAEQTGRESFTVEGGEVVTPETFTTEGLSEEGAGQINTPGLSKEKETLNTPGLSSEQPKQFTTPGLSSGRESFSTKEGQENEVEEAAEAVFYNPNQMLWVWANYEDVIDNEVKELTNGKVTDYPEDTREAMAAWEANPSTKNARLVVKEWDPVAEGLPVEVVAEANPMVTIQRTILYKGKYFKVAVEIRKDESSDWKEVGSLLNPNRFIRTTTRLPLDFNKAEDRKLVNPEFEKGEKGAILAENQSVLREGLWKWVSRQLDDAADSPVSITGAPLQKLLHDSNLKLNMHALRTRTKAEAIRRQQSIGEQTLIDKFPTEQYGRELKLEDGSTVKGLVFLDLKSFAKPTIKILYLDKAGNRIAANPSAEQKKQIMAEHMANKDGKQGRYYRELQQVAFITSFGKPNWVQLEHGLPTEANYAAVDKALEYYLTKEEDGLYPGEKHVFEKAGQNQSHNVYLLQGINETKEDDDFYIAIGLHDTSRPQGDRQVQVHAKLKVAMFPTRRTGDAIQKGVRSDFKVQLSFKIEGSWTSLQIIPEKSGNYYMIPTEIDGKRVGMKEAAKYKTYLDDLSLKSILSALTTTQNSASAATEVSPVVKMFNKELDLQLLSAGFRQGANQGESTDAFNMLPRLVPEAVANLEVVNREERISKDPELQDENVVQQLQETKVLGIKPTPKPPAVPPTVTTPTANEFTEEESGVDVDADTDPLAGVTGEAEVSERKGPKVIKEQPPTSGPIHVPDATDTDDIPFKLTSAYPEEVENFDTAKQELQRILNIPVEDIDTLTKNFSNKGVTMGAFLNGVVYLSRNMPKGTHWHEAFHVVFRSFLSNTQIERYLSLARERYGIPSPEELKAFKAQSSARATLTDTQLENLWLEEKMADDFMDYKNKGRSYNRKKQHSNIFVRLWNKLLEWIGIYSEKAGEIDALFNDIDLGRFKTAKPAYNVFRLRKDPAFLNYTVVREVQGGGRVLDTRNQLPSTDIRMVAALMHEYFRSKSITTPNREHVKLAMKELRKKFNYAPWLNVKPDASGAFWERLSSIHAALTSPKEATWKYVRQEDSIVETGSMLTDVTAGMDAATQQRTEKLLQKQYEENVDNLLKEVKLLDSVYTKEVFVHDEVELDTEKHEDEADNNNWDKTSDMYGGLTSTSLEFRRYLATTFAKMDYFEIGLSDNQLKDTKYGDLFKFPANPATLYNGMIAGMRDTLRKEVLRRFVVWSNENPAARLFKERLFRDIVNELKENEIEIEGSVDEWMSNPANVPTLIDKSNTYNTFVLGFHNHENLYNDLIADPARGERGTLVQVLNANQQDAASFQANRWAGRMQEVEARSRSNNQRFFRKGGELEIALSSVQYLLENYDGTDTQETVISIQELLQSVGITLSNNYIRYSLLRNGKVKLDEEISDADLLEFAAIYEDVEVDAMSGELIEGMVEAAKQVSSVSEFFLDEDKGAKGRILAIGAANANFDENMLRTSIQNSNGENVYPISAPSFMSTLAILYRSRSRRPFIDALRTLAQKNTKKNYDEAYKLYKELMADDLGLEEYLAKRYFDNIKDNPLLLGLTEDGYSNELSTRFLKHFVSHNLFGARLDTLKEAEDALDNEVIRDMRKNGVSGSADYTGLDNFSKNILKISLYVTSGNTIDRAYTKKAKGSGQREVVVPFRLFVPAVLSDKKTAKSYAMPVLNHTTKDMKLTKTGLATFLAHFKREAANIQKTKNEIADIIEGNKVTGIVDAYHYTTNKDGSRLTYHEGKVYRITPEYVTDENDVTTLNAINAEELNMSKEEALKIKRKLRGLKFFDVSDVLGVELNAYEDAAYDGDVDTKPLKELAEKHLQDNFYKFVATLMQDNKGVMPKVYDIANDETLKTVEGKLDYLKENGSPMVKDFFKRLDKLRCR